MAALELMCHRGVCYRMAWRVKHNIMQGMAERKVGRRFGGIVLMDDAYLGGKVDGAENKVPFVIAVLWPESTRSRRSRVAIQPSLLLSHGCWLPPHAANLGRNGACEP